jgi:hypothetical protein
MREKKCKDSTDSTILSLTSSYIVGMGKEKKPMKVPAKLGIIFCALLISLVLFSVIVDCSCAVKLFALNQPLHYDITVYAT